ncbi:flagellar assembly peptidoglycan hydrolase FlgJ, partial [Aromatoleum toluclasticum]|nr:flagellar assembly peptidoglycan hydrolase FlgJ [Aromatoleum toluclasticum]
IPRRAALGAGGELPAAKPAADADELAEVAARLGAVLGRPRSEAGGLRGAGDAGEAADAQSSRPVPEGAHEFVNRVWAHAGEASRSTGIPAHFMVGQAA